jgi:hypothetical protein
MCSCCWQLTGILPLCALCGLKDLRGFMAENNEFRYGGSGGDTIGLSREQMAGALRKGLPGCFVCL